MWKDKSISVVFPAYNEEENIGKAIKDFISSGYIDEVIVIDNNSLDKTAAEAEKAGANVLYETKQGYGYALQKGLREARGDYIIMAEPDGTFSGGDVLKLIAYADEFDMVMGTRTSKELIWSGAHMDLFLKWGNWAVAKILEVLFNGPSLTDMGCTLRLIRRSSLLKFLDRLSVGGSYFLAEMTILSLISSLRVIEIPVNYRPRVGKSKITGSRGNAIKVGLNMLITILKHRFWRSQCRGRLD